MKKTLRQRITQIKDIAVKEQLQVSDIADIVSEAGEYVSEPTLYKILGEDSENCNFQYHSVISVYEALIGRFGDMPDVQDADSLKRLLAERDKQIDRLVMQVEEKAEEFEQRDSIYADRKSVYEHAISLLTEQIAFKDEEIRRQAALIEKLINKIVE